MLNKTIRILNFDDSVIRQGNLLAQHKPEIIDLRGLAPRARLWMDAGTKNAVVKCLGPALENSVTFLGSGDFHHLSLVLLERIKEPFSLIVFDFHPDWDTLPPKFGCGSWVTQALKNKNLLKCVLLGASSSDISAWHIQSANLSSLKNNRLEIYPYAHAPTRVFLRKVPQNLSLKQEKRFLSTVIYWEELKNKDLSNFLPALFGRLPGRRVYLSIDKDCLQQKYALTNWEEGLFTLDDLLLALKMMRDNLEIIGADVTGDYSEPAVSGRLKKILSGLDHPKEVAAQKYPQDFINATNEAVNLAILAALTS